jgi:rootletin
MQVLLEANEKELQRLQEQLASIRSEKEALEGILFDTQTNLEATDTKRTQLEKEQQELMVKQEALKGQICRLTRDLESSEKRAQEMKATLTQQAGAQEAEFQQLIANLKKQNEETVRKLTEDRVSGIFLCFCTQTGTSVRRWIVPSEVPVSGLANLFEDVCPNCL